MSGYPTAKPALKIARTIIVAAIPGLQFGTKVPIERPLMFGRVQRAGGARPNLVTDRARILVELWAQSVGAVEGLANDAIAALQNAEGTVVLGAGVRCFNNIDGPVDLPDPLVGDMERWQFLGDLHLSI